MRAIPSEWLQPGAVVPVTPDTVRELLECVRVAYKAGQEAEREACAKLCASLMSHDADWDAHHWNQAVQRCEYVIRARGQP